MDAPAGGEGQAPGGGRGRGRRAAGSRRRGLVTLGVGAVAVVTGAWLGYRVGWESSRSDLEGLEGTVAWFLVVVGACLALLVLAAILRLVPHGRGQAASSLVLLAAGLVVAASFVVGSLVKPLGLGYRPPIALTAPGTMVIALEDLPRFTPAGVPVAECRFVGDGRDVQEILSLDLGELDGATLRGSVTLGDSALPGALDLWIDGADLAAGSSQPFWHGRVDRQGVAAGGRAGREIVRALPAEPADPSGLPAWPVLTGELTWTCEDWQ